LISKFVAIKTQTSTHPLEAHRVLVTSVNGLSKRSASRGCMRPELPLHGVLNRLTSAEKFQFTDHKSHFIQYSV